jgi:hypothetical protein
MVPGIIGENSQNQETRQNGEFTAEDTHQSEENVTTRFTSREAVQMLRLFRLVKHEMGN